jgi:hypothetical protein
VRVRVRKRFALRERARATPSRERRANGRADPKQEDDVDQLIASLAESVGLSGEAPRGGSLRRREKRGPSRRTPTVLVRSRPRIDAVSREVVFYLAAAIAAGAVVGILVPRLLP